MESIEEAILGVILEEEDAMAIAERCVEMKERVGDWTRLPLLLMS